MTWSIIKNFDDYKVSEEGVVYSIKNNVPLKPLNNGNGYLKVNLWKNGKLYNKYIHRLVAEEFIPNPSSLKYVDHIDRDKSNNHVSNLRWVSAKENTENTAQFPRYSKSRKGHKEYPKELVLQIKKEYNSGEGVMSLSRKYNIPRQSISRFIKS